jgi:hypothetical protein
MMFLGLDLWEYIIKLAKIQKYENIKLAKIQKYAKIKFFKTI